jgi:membrane-associated phospholipid phosphatase
MNQRNLLFWQPKLDFLRIFSSSFPGKIILIILNYLIWIFLFYISYLLVKNNSNIFGQILFATVVGEVIEKILKRKLYWRRPMFVRHDQTPVGLVDKWYQTGSFPSGHTIKATYFFLFLLQNNVFSVPAYLIIGAPLIIFRILVGFHYPIDILGGIGLGSLVWLSVQALTFPESFNQFIQVIFNFVFFIK